VADLNWPVLVIGFKRPDLMAKVLQEVVRANPPVIYFFCDGPTGEDDVANVLEVRALVDNMPPAIAIKTRFLPKNLGCRLGVEHALDWFFSETDAGIVLEDDCLPTQDFFRFADWMLSLYAENREVWMVSGTTSVSARRYLREGEKSHTFDLVGETWGWATWRRAWLAHERISRNFGPIGNQPKLLKLAESYPHTVGRVVKGYEAVGKGQVDTWDYQWAVSRILASGLNVAPIESLVTNIGFESRATHTRTRPFGIRDARPVSLPNHFQVQDVALNGRLVDAIERRMRWISFVRFVSKAAKTALLRPVDWIYRQWWARGL
jgi:hypothetical protein